MPLNVGFLSRKNSDPLNELNQKLQKNPRDVATLIERAEFFLARRDGASALQDVERGLQIALMEPRLQGDLRQITLGTLYLLQSRVCLVEEDQQGALAAVEKALEQNPDNLDAIVQRGRVLR